jgi:hypothetical protein
MNYLAILALSLGLLSVVITLQYIQRYKELNRDLKKVVAGQTSASGVSQSITRIKDKLDMTDVEFEKKLNTKEEKVVGVLKEPYSSSGLKVEPFETYYMSANQRGIEKNTTAFIRSIETEPVTTTLTYEDEERMAKESIMRPEPLPLGKIPYDTL